jgi:hypothetical protein
VYAVSVTEWLVTESIFLRVADNQIKTHLEPAIVRLASTVLVLAFVSMPATAQSLSQFTGMWSDPPATPEGQACFPEFCTDALLSRLNALLDDPANDNRKFEALVDEAAKYQQDTYIAPHLTAEALKTYPLSEADDPGFVQCEPWGAARQIFGPHQLEIRQRGGGVIEMHYGEWDTKRTIYLQPRNPPIPRTPSRMGVSTGRMEGGELVIETRAIAANWTNYLALHSDQLTIVERYTRARDGKVLYLTATFTDPVTLKEPIVLKKVWRWAPNSKIAPYKDCQLPTGLVSKGR